MQRTIVMIGLMALGLVGTTAFWAKDAEAIPVFARKYDISCNSCHTMFPKLTKMGVSFRERGFRLAAGRDDLGSQSATGGNKEIDGGKPEAIIPASFPFTVRTRILYSSAGPNEVGGQPVMPGHQFGMLDGATRFDPDPANPMSNPKFGFGEFGLITSGSFDEFSWWIDANLDGIQMSEGIYYVNDLLKIRAGRFQNNVGYGMTMMSRRPLGFGTLDAAQMQGMVMMMMGQGISIHGTTDGDTGVGTSYQVSYSDYGKNEAFNNSRNNAWYGRLAQEIMGNHILGVYGYLGKNWSSDSFGGEADMFMRMVNPMTMTEFAGVAEFTDVSRYGFDFAINYGEPIQAYGAFTFGKNKNVNGTSLDVRGFTTAAEWMFADDMLVGAKWDYSRSELQMMANSVLRPTATNHFTVFGIYQIAQNVQGSVSYTATRNLVTEMSAAAGATTAEQADLNTFVAAVDFAL